MTYNPEISLIVSTYNWPEALNLCLESIRKQVHLPDEVIIADDGSGETTRLLIEKHQKSFPVPLIHVWQADEGFQLSKIRNKAIAKASKEYIVQIDGDLILERHFIQDHVAFRKVNSFVSGTRVQVSALLTDKLLYNNLEQVSIFSKGISNFSNAFRIPFLSKLLASRYRKKDAAFVRGCNMAFWKKDLVKVNGYNEAIVGWGREDSELAIRLLNSEVSKRIFKFGAVTYHLYHKELHRELLTTNEGILMDAIKTKVNNCKLGLADHLDKT
ncbi:MAG: putative two-domain glycosyltransferase [Pedobacter sp.]|nr:putative two-domain glycosyltransferase [Pedobacter sp.]